MNLINSDCLISLKDMEDNSVDSLITDPPAGISFMSKKWDEDKGGRDEWIKWMTEIMSECLRVLKPGGHGLVWALPRTSHWTATALEDSGFEIRDVVTHLFGSGFPKSHNIGKKVAEFDGWGSSLKPAVEFWHLVRSPLSEKTIAKNVLKWGTGGINIDKSRIPANNYTWENDQNLCNSCVKAAISSRKHTTLVTKEFSVQENADTSSIENQNGQMQVDTNTMDTGCLEEMSKDNINADSSMCISGKNTTEKRNQKDTSSTISIMTKPIIESKTCGSCGLAITLDITKTQGRFPSNLVLDEEAGKMLDEQSGDRPDGYRINPSTQSGSTFHNNGGVGERGYNDKGGASRFFYCAKASKSDRGKNNNHPTVKATKLMKYLIRLITPPSGIVFDPFMGSGSTGVAAKSEGFEFIGIEKESEYFDIAKKRIGVDVESS